MTRRFTGWHFTAIILAFFGVVVAVNLTMAVLATRTFGGVVVENSYVASQKYNDWLAAAKRQQRLAWTIEPVLDEQRRVVISMSIDGASVSGFARHPLGREPDVSLTFVSNGAEARSVSALPQGRWNIHLLVRRGESEARLIETLS
ncbi:MAG TPA: FixH family protein [Sphingomicrobium sp.]|nr:FixH family protein [Sphingomicrobium sp.]